MVSYQKMYDAAQQLLMPVWYSSDLSPQSMRTMGSKLGAKEVAKKFNVPLVPGTDYAISDIEKARQIVVDIGFGID